MIAIILVILKIDYGIMWKTVSLQCMSKLIFEWSKYAF